MNAQLSGLKNGQFTPEERELLRGYQSTVGRQVNCSQVYVGLILDGKRNKETEKAQAVLKSCRELLNYLQKASA